MEDHVAGQLEDRLRGDEQREGGIRDDRAGQAGQQGRRFEGGGGIKDFAGEQGTAQRCPEDGPDAPGGAGEHQQPPVDWREFQHAAQQRAEAGPDLGDRALLSRGAPRADRDDRGDGLDQRHPRPDHPAPPMERPDHRVGPMPLRLGGPGEDQQARDQAPHRRDQQHQPPGIGIADRLGMPLPRRRHPEVEPVAKHVAVHELERSRKPTAPRPAITPTTGLHSATRPIRGDDQSAASRLTSSRSQAKSRSGPEASGSFDCDMNNRSSMQGKVSAGAQPSSRISTMACPIRVEDATIPADRPSRVQNSSTE